MLLASVRGFDRRRYIELAETLHPGISQTEVFRLWLEATPIVVSRFLPLLRHRRDNEMRVHGSQADDRQPMTGGAHAA